MLSPSEMLTVLLLSLLWSWHGQDKHVVHWGSSENDPSGAKSKAALHSASCKQSQANSKASHSRLNLVQSKRKLLKGSH